MKFRKIFLLAMSCFTLAGCDFSGFTKNLDDKEEDPEVQREDDYYTVSFYGYQNELLETQQVLEGKQPVFPDYNEVILMGDYSLNFVGWSETFPRGVYSDTSVYAEFKAEYTVTFYNKDNTIYKQMFAMEGDPAPDIPGLPNYADPNDSNYDYKFIYWEFKSGIQNGYVVGNVQAYPVFQRTQSRFLVNFFNYNGTLLYSNYTDRDGKIVYNGPTPIKQADEEGYYYEFTGWSEDLNHITSNTNVEATFERKKHKIGYKVDDMTQYDNGSLYLKSNYNFESYEYDFNLSLLMKKEIVFDGSNFQVLKKRFLLDKKTYQQMLSSFSWLEPAKGEIENRYLMSQRNILYKDGFYYYESGNPLWEYFTIYIYEDNAYFKYEKAFGLESFIRTKVDFSRYTDLDDFKFYNECECLVGSYPTIHYNEVGEYYYKNSSNCERKIYFNENKVAFKFEYCNHDNPSQICVANISPYNGSKLTAPDYDNSLLKHRANEALMECISFIDKDTGESYTPSYNGGHNTINHIKNPGTVIIPKYYVTRTEDNTEILLSVGSLCMFGVDLPPGMTLEERDVYYYHNYSITYDSSNIYFSTNFAPGGRCSQYQIYISSVEYGDMSFYLEQPIICMFEFTDL